ncbi:MAG: aspartyl protease family protein [Planctomycetes bacterium]|nr:aspartyl protease family protein [Planctomycetota bacterium]
MFSWRCAITLLLASVAQAQEEIVAFELVERIIVVQGSLDGHEATWIVDTGASQTVVTPAAARRAGLEPGRSAVCGAIAAGQAVARNLRVMVDDPEAAHYLRQIGVDYDGLLGTPYLERFRFTIDYPNRRLILAPPGAVDEPGTVVPCERTNNLLWVEGRLNDRGRRLNLLFDCGAQITVLRPALAKEFDLVGRPSLRPEIRWTTLDSLAIGDAEVTSCAAVLHEPQAMREMNDLGLKCDGFLGANWLENFRVTIDYRSRKIHLARAEKPRAETAPPEAPRPPLGLNLMETRVDEVDPGSAAEKAGFRAGDVIVGGAGQDVRFVEEIRAIVAGAKRGESLLFTVRRGKEKVALTLAW